MSLRQPCAVMPAQSPMPGNSTLKPIPAWRRDWMGLAGGAILVAGTITVYWRTFAVPLLFDDQLSITRNLSIRSLWPIWPALTPPNDAGAGGRPLLNLSYALNYAFGGTGGLWLSSGQSDYSRAGGLDPVRVGATHAIAPRPREALRFGRHGFGARRQRDLGLAPRPNRIGDLSVPTGGIAHGAVLSASVLGSRIVGSLTGFETTKENDFADSSKARKPPRLGSLITARNLWSRAALVCRSRMLNAQTPAAHTRS